MKETTQNKSFTTVLTLVLACLIGFLISENKLWIYAGLILGVPSILSTFIATRIDKLWMKLSFILSKIAPNILLSIVYFLCLVPIAILSKAFTKKDMLILKNEGNSLFVDVNENYDKTFFEKPW